MKPLSCAILWPKQLTFEDGSACRALNFEAHLPLMTKSQSTNHECERGSLGMCRIRILVFWALHLGAHVWNHPSMRLITSITKPIINSESQRPNE